MKTILDVRCILIKSGIAVVLVGVIAILTFGFRLRREYHHAFLEAKNIELTLRLLSFDYYKVDRPIYDSLSPDGLAGGVAEDVKVLSGADGLVTLDYWDAARQAAGSFVYKKGNIAIFYEYDKNIAQETWSVYYQIHVVDYWGEKLQT